LLNLILKESKKK